ncbi:MAG: hypothetical protein N2V72_04870 [Methanophagales archaeon]|nr:hypothetical protein [Methanophagales archaeon]
MRDKFWARLLAISVAIVTVVSCIAPCIAVGDLNDNASTDETLLRKAFTEKSFTAMMPFYANANATKYAHRTPFDHPWINEEGSFHLLLDSNVSFPPNIIYVPDDCAKIQWVVDKCKYKYKEGENIVIA